MLCTIINTLLLSLLHSYTQYRYILYTPMHTRIHMYTQVVNVSNNRSNIDALCKGVCLVLLLSGPAATETAVDVLSKVMATTTTASSVIATQTGAQVSELTD